MKYLKQLYFMFMAKTSIGAEEEAEEEVEEEVGDEEVVVGAEVEEGVE